MVKYEQDYPKHKRFIWNSILFVMYYAYKVRYAIEDAYHEVVYRLKPKNPSVKAYADFMRKL